MFFSSKFYYDENRIKIIIKHVKKTLTSKNFSYKIVISIYNKSMSTHK